MESPLSIFLQGTCDFLDFKDFELIAFFDVVEIFQGQTAFEAGFDFFCIILEAFQRIEFTGPDHDVLTQQAYRCTAFDDAFEYIATCNRTDFADQNNLTNLDQTQSLFAFFWRQHAGHRCLDFVYCIVNDVVVANINAVGFCQLASRSISTGVKADDDRFRSNREVDVGLGNATHRCMHNLHAHFAGFWLSQPMLLANLVRRS